ncbi:MAG: threonine aldolase [Crocinitomicaceae bacterium]|nr:threonine aldolase [Crocinitomicaceae bacterium]|tara:strand:+ start:183 stop:1220 length:1038 start_codon:yes stop_codon:yes gene_type:complete
MSTTIDLRSDTVTKPTLEMREVMNRAVTGDDVFAEDPEINELQDRCASMFGMEAGLYCPSGTMTNQIAISVHTSKGDEVICDKLSHVYNYEGGGIARLAGASVKLLNGDRGRFTAQDVMDSINPDDSHYANTSLVCLEDTCNKGGGAVWDLSQIKSVSVVSRENGLGVHLDGARVWNSLVARGIHNNLKATKEYGSHFDSISLCLSKGLGCPVGSVLIGSKEFIANAHRTRKVFGGGMRQAGIIAAAGIYALDYHIDRLAEDHVKAKRLGEAALNHPCVKSYSSIDTNIVILHLEEGVDSQELVDSWGDKGVLCFPFSKSSIRFVTHHDVTDAQVDIAAQLICEK